MINKFLAILAIIVFTSNQVNATCYAALSANHPNESSVSYSTTGYGEVPCSPVEGQRTAVIIILGQSLATNSVNSAYTPTHTLNQQLNIYDSKCYQAKGKALGISGVYPSWIGARLGDVLIDRNLYDRVIMVPMSIGGTWATEWANTTVKPFLGRRIGNVECMLQSVGLEPSYVIWMQGENETNGRTTQAAYTASLNTIIGLIRNSGITAPILINIETWLNGVIWTPVQNAQKSVVGTNNVIQGANIDSLNNSYRYDGTHLNANGAIAATNLLADIIASSTPP